MLSLKPPFLQAGKDLVIFRDDEDASCFYYLNQQPHLSSDSQGKPVISGYSILPGSGTYPQDAFPEVGISLQVDLEPGQNQLESAEQCIREAWNITPKRLVPAPFHSGKVRFLVAQTGKDGTASDRWMVTSEVIPSMVGNNSASLVIRANGLEAELLMASVRTGAVAATVSYEMEITGMTPVYHARIEAKMHRIYEKFRAYKKEDFLFYRKEVEEVISRLEQGKDIVVTVEETDPVIKAEAMSALFDLLMKHILDVLFEPVTVQPVQQVSSPGPLRSLLDGVAGLVQSLAPGYCTLRSSIAENVAENWFVDLNQRSAKTMPVCSNAPLAELIAMAGVDPTGLIEPIILDQLPVFRQMLNVRVSPHTFENSNIDSLVVQCRVRDLDTGETVMNPQSKAFTGDQLAWDLPFNRRKDHRYAYEYQVVMHVADTGADLIDTEVPLTGDGWKQATSSYIDINPADFCRNLSLDLNISDFTVFDSVGMIRADVDVIPKDGGESLFHKPFVFTEAEKESAHKKLNLLVKRDMQLKFRIRLSYDLFGQEPVRLDSDAEEGSLFIIPNPFVNRWHVDLYCDADWETVRKVKLDIRIADPSRPRTISEHFTFDRDHEEDTLYAAVGPGATPRVFEYLVTRFGSDGNVSAGWYRHGDTPNLFINASLLVPEKVVRFRIEDPDTLERLDIGKAKVLFRSTVGGKEEEEQEKPFSASEEVTEFLCPAGAACSYRLVFLTTGGKSVGPSKWSPLPEGCDLVTVNVSQLNNG